LKYQAQHDCGIVCAPHASKLLKTLPSCHLEMCRLSYTYAYNLMFVILYTARTPAAKALQVSYIRRFTSHDS